MIEGLNHAVNFGMEFLVKQEVSIACSGQEAKLVTGSEGQERLTRLCSVTGSKFPFINKGKRVDKVRKKYMGWEWGQINIFLNHRFIVVSLIKMG